MNDGNIRNEEGMMYYKNLCRELTENGIKCIVTLFHADLPLSIYNEGSWLTDETIDYFVQFAQYCFEELGEWVEYWITFNEIRMHAWSGIVKVEGEPYHSLDLPYKKFIGDVPIENAIMIGTKNMMIAHAKVYRLYKKKYDDKYNGQIGIVVGGHFCYDENEDISSISSRVTDSMVGMNLDPLINNEHQWSPITIQYLNPLFNKQDKQLIKGTIDFIGLNYYRPHLVSEKGQRNGLAEQLFNFSYVNDKWPRISGDSSWLRFHPKGLFSMLEYMRDKYQDIPILITENGLADLPNGDSFEDNNRIEYMKGHIEVIKQGRMNGFNVIGYTAWSLMDNLEWDDGFSLKFGLFHVDFNSNDIIRREKKSVQYYRHAINSFQM